MLTPQDSEFRDELFAGFHAAIKKKRLLCVYLTLKWTAGELNPDFLVANQMSCRWTSSPEFFVIQDLTQTISERMSLAVTGPPTTASSERLCAFRFSVASCGDQTAESDPCFDATRKCDRISPGFP